MNRTRSEQRANRRRKIAQRKNLLNNINTNWSDPGVSFCEHKEIKDGYLDNNNEMNKYSNGGRAKKTKAKHGHSTYRHKGAYGPAINRNTHDQRQVDAMDYQEEEMECVD